MAKLPYARDRMVESHIWGVAYGPEPRDSYARVSLTKIVQMITLMNDTYDNYCTVEEGDLFTKNLERFVNIYLGLEKSSFCFFIWVCNVA